MSSPPETPRRGWPARWAMAFGKFWWDFLVGDTPELFAGALLLIGLVALLVHIHAGRLLVVVALPALTAVLLALSLGRAWRHNRG